MLHRELFFGVLFVIIFVFPLFVPLIHSNLTNWSELLECVNLTTMICVMKWKKEVWRREILGIVIWSPDS